MEYFVLRNSNNNLTIITKNTRQLDFNRPDIVFFFRGNKWTNKAKTNKEARSLYWVSNSDYVNDLKGWVILNLEKDNFWQYWGNAANSRGKANITSSTLGTAHAEHKEDYHLQNEEYCRACDNCYDFCGDLRNKRAVPVGYINPSKPQFQPRWKVGFIGNKGGIGGGMTGLSIPNETGEEDIKFPNSIKVIDYHGGTVDLSGENPKIFWLLDIEHDLSDGRPISKAIHKPKLAGNEPKENFYWEELPKCYAEQPHLLNHSSAQFFFQRKLLMTANLKHLLVRRQKGGSGSTGIAKEGLKWVLGYHVIIRSSISGILYNFESGEIFFKWELRVSSSYQNIEFLDGLIDGAFKNLGGNWIENKLEELGSIGDGGTGWMTAIPSFFKTFMAAIKGWVKKQAGADLNQILTGDKMKEVMGVKQSQSQSDSDNKQAEAEKNTDRKKKSTSKNQHRTVELSLFYGNTINIDYDAYEFANRTISFPFMIRFDHSNLLYDNLVNNRQNPVQQFTVNNFSQLKQILAEGEWQGQVELFDFPIQGIFEQILSNTNFYRDLTEHFKPWQPQFRTLQSYTYGDTSNMDVAVGQEEVDVTENKKTEKVNIELMNTNMNDADYGNVDYIGSPDANIWEELNRVNNNIHVGNSPFPNNCLGCLCGGGSHGNPNYNFERTYNFTSGGRICVKTRGSGAQEREIPANGGTVKFWAKGNSGGLSLETTREWIEKDYKYNFKFDKTEAQKEEEIKGIDYKELDFLPQETELDIDIDMELDQDKEEMDIDEDWGKDQDANEQEPDDDWDKDLDKDIDQDIDQDTDEDLDNDLDIDLDIDEDIDDDVDTDTDDDKDKDQDKDDRDDDSGDDDNDQDRE